MEKYKVTWVNYSLPSGREFAVAVCGYAGKVCYMTLGIDTFVRNLVCQACIEKGQCQSAEHCLAISCELNRTERGHAMHMLEMFQDEKTDEETAELWGTVSAIESLINFSQKMNDILPEELRKRQAPETE